MKVYELIRFLRDCGDNFEIMFPSQKAWVYFEEKHIQSVVSCLIFNCANESEIEQLKNENKRLKGENRLLNLRYWLMRVRISVANTKIEQLKEQLEANNVDTIKQLHEDAFLTYEEQIKQLEESNARRGRQLDNRYWHTIKQYNNIIELKNTIKQLKMEAAKRIEDLELHIGSQHAEILVLKTRCAKLRKGQIVYLIRGDF